MTFKEWWKTFSRDSVDGDVDLLVKAAWEAGHNEGFKDYKDKLEGDQYVLVPVEPTEKMVKAGDVLWDHHCTSIYEAMIQASREEE